MQKIDISNKTVFVTGAAGFIGANLCIRLLKDYPAMRVVGIDNVNSYYDPQLKEWRLKEIDKVADGRYTFIRGDLADR